MTRRTLLPLAAAVAVAACAPPAGTPAGTGQPVSYDQKVKRIEALTQALSLGQNEELQKSLQGAQTVSQTMSQGAFKQTTAAASGMVAAGGGNMVAAGGGNLVAAGGGNLVAAGGGNIVAAGGMNYALRALVEDLNRAVAQDVYKLAATASLEDGSTVTYDDLTGELQAVQAPNAAATFTLATKGDTRTWTMNLTKSPDGTVGTMTVEIAAGAWVDQVVQPDAPQAFPSTAPFGEDDGANGQPPFGDNDADSDLDADADSGLDDGSDGGLGDGGFGLQQAEGQPPFKIFGGQQPDFNTVSRVRFKADFKAQGQDNLRMVIDALLDEWAPAQGSRVPARFGLNFDVASLGIQTDTRIGWATLDLTSKGGFKIRTKAAQETFTYGLDFKAKASTGKLDVTSDSARLRFSAAVKPGANGGAPQTVTGLFDSDTGAKLADLVPAPGKPNSLEIRFTDGRVLQWDPASGQTTTLVGGSASSRPSTRPSAAAGGFFPVGAGASTPAPSATPAGGAPTTGFPKF